VVFTGKEIPSKYSKCTVLSWSVDVSTSSVNVSFEPKKHSSSIGDIDAG
jgi:hypothetical protein